MHRKLTAVGVALRRCFYRSNPGADRSEDTRCRGGRRARGGHRGNRRSRRRGNAAPPPPGCGRAGGRDPRERKGGIITFGYPRPDDANGSAACSPGLIQPCDNDVAAHQLGYECIASPFDQNIDQNLPPPKIPTWGGMDSARESPPAGRCPRSFSQAECPLRGTHVPRSPSSTLVFEPLSEYVVEIEKSRTAPPPGYPAGGASDYPCSPWSQVE